MPRAESAAARRAALSSGLVAGRALRRARAVLDLVRWENALVAAAGVALGAWWAAGGLGVGSAFAAVAAVGLTALANAFNDYRDRDIDALAHEARPLPSGRAAPADALAVATVGGVLALVASLRVSRDVGVATVGVAAVMIAYSLWLKGRGAPGNVAVAVLASLPFVYGAWSVGAPVRGALLFGLAVPLHFAREVAKDVDDAGADADASRRRTLPLSIGNAGARRVVVGALTLFGGAAVGTFYSRGGPTAAMLLAPAVACCAVASRRAWSGRPGVPRLLKAAMLLAMGAAAVARVRGLV